MSANKEVKKTDENSGSTSLQVEAIESGTVIDHIPSGQGVKILKHLHLLDRQARITVGFNLPSKAMGFKDIIKIESHHFDESEVNRMAIFAPHATINRIEKYKVVHKVEMLLPSTIKGIFTCPNSNCISHNEPVPPTFLLSERKDTTMFKCHYCEKAFARDIFTEI